jgi:hypothetical protein
VSGRFAVIEFQQPAEPAVALDWPGSGIGVVLRREEDDVVLALVWTLVMVVLDEIVDGALEGGFAEQDQAIETFLLNAPDEPLGEGIEVGATWQQAQQFDARRCDDVAKRRRKLSGKGVSGKGVISHYCKNLSFCRDELKVGRTKADANLYYSRRRPAAVCAGPFRSNICIEYTLGGHCVRRQIRIPRPGVGGPTRLAA